jgi:hypothetical protein
MKRKTIGIFLLVAAALLLAFPVRMTCGHPSYSCVTAPDTTGTYYTYYEIEPLGITALEALIGTNLRVAYWSGSEGHPLK